MDRHTIIQYVNGDTAAFRTIFRTAVSEVYWLAYRIVGNKETAEDVVQETFLRIHQMQKQIDPARSLESLILRIATNLAIDHLRKARRELQQPHSQEAPSPAYQSETVSESEEETHASRITLDDTLAQLPDIYRIVLVLKYAHDMSYQEIAASLNISVPAVALRLKRGKELLRQKLVVQENKL